MFFSKSTKGFYLVEIHGENIPPDAVEISLEKHQELLDGQSAGLQISADDLGQPILIQQPVQEQPTTV